MTDLLHNLQYKTVALMFYHILVCLAAVSAKPTFKHIPKVCCYSVLLIGLDILVKGFNRFVFSFFRCLVDMSCNWALAVLRRVLPP